MWTTRTIIDDTDNRDSFMSISARGREGGGTQGLKRGKVKNNTRKIIYNFVNS